MKHNQPDAVVNNKDKDTTCAEYLANVEADADQPPQMRRPAVHLQHAFEYLHFEPGKRFSIDMKAYREGKHKSECKKLDKWLIAIRRKFVEALPEQQQALLEWEFGTGNSCQLGTLPKHWEEYGEQNYVHPSELPVILCINAPFFRKSDNPDLEWALHLPFKICSPNLLLSRPSNKDPLTPHSTRRSRRCSALPPPSPSRSPLPPRSARPRAMHPALRRVKWSRPLARRSLPT